jgi:hypothetical protein
VAEIKRATVKSYDAATHKATVQIAGSLGVWLDGVRVATNIPAADVVADRQCTVLFLDPSNQDDAVVIAIQGASPSGGAGGFDHAPVGGYYPGVLSTGVKTTPQVPYKGDGFTITTLYCRLAVAAQTQDAKVKIRRNGTSMGEVVITKNTNTGSLSVSVTVSDGDYFDIEITQVGTSPNEGSDLVWMVVP